MRKRGVTVYPETEVLDIDELNHKIKVKDLKTGEVRFDSYDRLILSVGMEANVPEYGDLDKENIFLFAGRDNGLSLKKLADSKEIQEVVVIGGGYIALEASISFAKNGKKVTMLERCERPLTANLDKELIDVIIEELNKNNIIFTPNVNVKDIEIKGGKATSVVSDKGTYPADLVIVSIGNHPNTAWLKDILKLDERGFIIVDDYMKTSAKDVFAVGGATLMKYNPSGEYRNVDLATCARKQGRVAAKNLNGDTFPYTGTQGTSGLQVFDYSFASTGINERVAQSSPKYRSVYVERLALDEYLPENMNAKVYAKLYYNVENRQVVGGQILSKHNLTGLIQALSMAIKGRLTIDDLAFGDFFFQPLFNRPWNLLNILGLEAQKQESEK